MTGLTDVQHDERRTRIGASEVASCLALPDAFGSPQDVALRLMDPESQPRLDFLLLRAGLATEELNAAEFERATGKVLRNDHRSRTSKKFPWLVTHLDRLVKGERLPCELKLVTGGQRDAWGETGSDEVPARVNVQVQAQMLVCDVKLAYVSAIIDMREHRWFAVPAHKPLQDIIIDRTRDVWEHAQRGELPPIDTSHPGAVDLLRKVYPNIEDDEIVLPDEAATAAREYLEARAEIAQMEKLQKTRQAIIALAMEQHGKGITDAAIVKRIGVSRRDFKGAVEALQAAGVEVPIETKASVSMRIDWRKD